MTVYFKHIIKYIPLTEGEEMQSKDSLLQRNASLGAAREPLFHGGVQGKVLCMVHVKN